MKEREKENRRESDVTNIPNCDDNQTNCYFSSKVSIIYLLRIFKTIIYR